MPVNSHLGAECRLYILGSLFRKNCSDVARADLGRNGLSADAAFPSYPGNLPNHVSGKPRLLLG
jgi:hypothetical protein